MKNENAIVGFVENLWNKFWLFVLLPIPMWQIFRNGAPFGEWNTWLVNDSRSAKRQYSGSVSLMFAIWIGIAATAMVACAEYYYFESRGWQFVLALLITWIVNLFPKMATAYETWNWAKATNILAALHRHGLTDKTTFPKAIKEFLVEQFGHASRSGDFARFNHLESVFRCLDVWKGKRQEIVAIHDANVRISNFLMKLLTSGVRGEQDTSINVRIFLVRELADAISSQSTLRYDVIESYMTANGMWEGTRDELAPAAIELAKGTV